jgi:hypothetical protein
MNALTKLGKGATIALIGIIVAALAGAGILAGALVKAKAEPLVPAADRATPAPPSPTPSSSSDAQRTLLDLGGMIQVRLPRPWQSLGSGSDWAMLTDGKNDWIYLQLDTVKDPSVDSGTVLNELFSQVVSPDHYSQLQPGPVSPREPFGQVISRSAMAYDALVIDTQGTLALRGNIWVGIRQDGAVLTMTAETTPPGDFDAHFAQNVLSVYRSIWKSFGQGNLP